MEKKKKNCSSIQERETMDLYTKQREGKLHADYQSRSPKVSTSAEPSSSAGGRRGRRGQARLVGADQAGEGRRGRWGRQATGLMPESTSIED